MRKLSWVLYGLGLSSLASGAWIAALNIEAYELTRSLTILSVMWTIRIVVRVLVQPIAGTIIDRSQDFRVVWFAYFLHT